MVKISRCMSTQHPDNISTPFFSDSDVISGEAEVKEAFYVFSQLSCKEQMWDSEGKEVDNQVVEKLMSKYTDFFKSTRLGKDLFLTYRVPNPAVEKEQGKILLETLYSIPRAFDAARVINSDIPPIFEVILPMTTESVQISMVKDYYEKIIIGQNNIKIGKRTVSEWVGEFKPDHINVIPLFEDIDSIMNSASIVEDYLKGKDSEYQRVFLARSDPALNYGSAPAVLMAKCALYDLQKLEEKISVDILPIIGVGSAPFRGNFRPDNVINCGDEYPSVQTFTAQSSFKYDNPFRDVFNAIDMLNYSKRGVALVIEKKEALPLIKKIKEEYQKQIMSVADLINKISNHVPGRRARKLHIGLFGYARSMKGVKLPRAIKFCASFYSIGIPPEILGLSALNEKEMDKLRGMYSKIDEDIKDSIKYLNSANLSNLPKEISTGVKKVLEHFNYEEDEQYCDITSRILNNVKKGQDATISEDVKRAGYLRKFLG